MSRGQHPVHDQPADAHAGVVELGQRPGGLLDRQTLGDQHQHERGGPSADQAGPQRLQAVEALGQRLEDRIVLVVALDAEHRPARPRQRPHPRFHQLGHADQAQRVAGGRGVEDHQVEARVLAEDQLAHPVEERHLLGAGHRGRQVDLLERLLEDRVAEQRAHAILDLADVAGRLGGRVDFEAPQPALHLHRFRSDPPLEDVGGGVRGIRGHQQHPLADAARSQRHRRRARGLADAALAAEEQHLPVEQPLHRGQQHGRLPSGERSMPIRRCQRWNWSSRCG